MHLNELKRWPCVAVSKKIVEAKFSITSSFGGLIYFTSPKEGGELKVVLKNVVEAPYFDLISKNNVNEWINQSRHKPGLWAEIAGEHIIFTMPSKAAKLIANPHELVKYWDEVVKSHHELRGTNPNDYKRERVVNDMQLYIGYMHSTYPIVTHLDVCYPCNSNCTVASIYSLKELKEKGSWSLYHELGHNLQRDEWTFDGSLEVTVNIFALHALEKINKIPILEQKWVVDASLDFKRYFLKKPRYNDWKDDVGTAFLLFFKLINHFGWPPMNKFMKQYEDDIKNNKVDVLPGNNNQNKIDQWVIRYSLLVSRNIKPLFEMFGLPVSSNVDEKIKHLDEISLEEEQKDPLNFFKPPSLSKKSMK
jgi:hypothetical protein